MFLGRDAQLVVKGMVPNVFDLVPMHNDAGLDGRAEPAAALAIHYVVQKRLSQGLASCVCVVRVCVYVCVCVRVCVVCVCVCVCPVRMCVGRGAPPDSDCIL